MIARDSKGRFKKGPRSKKKTQTPLEAAEEFNKVHNPDCGPATKGYVKCIARKTLNHRHEQSSNSGYAFAVTVLSGISVLICMGISNSVDISPRLASFFATGAMVSAGVFVSLLVVWLELMDIGEHRTCQSDDYISQIQKYQPPTCEKKRDCE